MMQRRSALICLGAVCLGSRMVRGVSTSRMDELVRQMGETAERVATAAGGLPENGQIVRLCRLVAGHSRARRPVSPALVQATLDACRRRDDQRSAARQTGFRSAAADFRRIGQQFVEASAV